MSVADVPVLACSASVSTASVDLSVHTELLSRHISRPPAASSLGHRETGELQAWFSSVRKFNITMSLLLISSLLSGGANINILGLEIFHSHENR